ncbi:conserved hypothetical protein [Ricinus communis]|uniref:SH3b domain-containing protein n=1 Tax=Ricinus communis TaxID=3988 RepID=B9TEF3_RICCO|nr:conserved hypothetical protein [Ricinus communis]
MNALQLQDPLKEYREAMKAIQIQDPMKGIRETIKSLQLQDSLKEYRDAMKAVQIQDPMKGIRETIKALQLQDPSKEYRDAMKAVQIQDPMKGIRETIKALQLQDPLKEYRDAMKAIQIQDQMKGIRETIKAFQLQDPLKEYRDALNATRSVTPKLTDGLKALGLENILETISQQEWPQAHAVVDGDITVNLDDTVTVDSTRLSYYEIQQFVNEISDRAFNRSSQRIDSAVAALIAEIHSLKNPPLEKFLSLLIYPIIVALIFSIINPITDYYIKESLGSEKREAVKKIRKHVLASTNEISELDSYRLVSRKYLDMRSTPSAKSPLLGRLQVGQVVMLIEKRKDWSLVAWSDDENEVAIQGWVFSRYLEKFR